MGKRQHAKDRMFVTQTEWARDYGGKRATKQQQQFRSLPFNYCALSFAPVETPCCTADGVVFDLLHVVPYIRKWKKHPVTGEAMSTKDLVRLTLHKNAEGKYHCPVTFKEFNEHTRIAAIRTSGHVYSYDAVHELNVKAKNWTDLMTGEPFTRKDIITIQDPARKDARDVTKFYHVLEQNGAGAEAVEEGKKAAGSAAAGGIRQNPSARRVLEKLATEGGEAVSESRRLGIANDPQDVALAAARAAEDGGGAQSRFTNKYYSGSFTSTAMDPTTRATKAAASEEEVLSRRHKAVRKLGKKAYVQLGTSVGNLNLELHADLVPCACDNFVGLCEKGYYDGVAFHRLVPGFCIQGGDPTGTGRGGDSLWGKPFGDEFHPKLRHSERGVLSMANSGPKTNKSQFFILFAGQRHLDDKHTVFGRVVGGMAVLDRMEGAGVGAGERPKEAITITHATVFVNPFNEVEAVEAEEAKAAEQRKADEDLARRRAAETRKRAAAATEPTAGGDGAESGVGRYLKEAMRRKGGGAKSGAAAQPSSAEEEAAAGAPRAKRARAGRAGFGNFDGW